MLPTPSPPTPLRGRMWRRLFGIPEREIDMDRRGFFTGVPGMQARLETCGGAFMRGYNLALGDAGTAALTAGLETVPRDVRGFAYEGAAMGLALLDRLTPWNRQRLAAFLAGPAEPHCYLAHVGAGWVLGRLPVNVERFLARLDPLQRWLALDGYGFHEGFFQPARYTAGEAAPARLQGYARRAFDQGLGRSFWFVHGGSVSRIADNIRQLSEARRADLWSGAGLGATYAGGASSADLDTLAESAGTYRPQLAQGSAFAAKARVRAGNASAYTDAACHALCELSAQEAADVTDACLEDLPADAAQPSFEIWRQRIQQHFAPTLVL